jgi:catechol 2,3-dioxygenase-like lactoylglutathione lyase family enzyme
VGKRDRGRARRARRLSGRIRDRAGQPATSADAGRYDRYRIGIHHIAFQAPSREIVDERLRWARGQGLEIENDPKEYDYRPGYYAGFLYDPDGIKLEIVHVP